MKAIIIDDEAHCIKALQNDIAMFCPQVNVIDNCRSAKDGILSIKHHCPDLIFLDVEMPWMNGFEMLEIIPEINFHIIFTTAYDQFAARAFRVSAVDYLLKPIDGTELQAAVAKVEEAIAKKQGSAHIENFIHNSKSPAIEQKIAIPTRDGFDFIQVNDILYCKANGSYTEITLADRKNILLSRSLGETEQLLPPEIFERIHHSTLVNIQHIKQFIRTSGTYVVMDDGNELNVSKSKKDQLLVRMGIRQ
ncbi:MAG: hypothetical protein BGO52_12060 [Sphingobacteriales bacterium 44-61]|nr:MAG: hypothetical protein BGO52_12060 [Sphingobacteriales bacterium 44-61]